MFRKLLPVLVLTLMVSQLSFSQWTREKGKGYYKISAWSLVSDQHYTDTGEIDPNATRGYFNTNFYGEYGLTDKFDVVLYFPFFARTYQNEQVSGTTGMTIQESESVNGVGDIDLSIRYGLIKNENIAISTSLKLGLPTGNDSGGSDGSFQTGDGEFNQLLQIDAGVPYRLSNIPAFAKVYFGFNNRTENFSDELYYGLESGLNFLNEKLWVIGRLNILSSLNNGSISAENNQGSIFANNIEYTSIGGEIAYYITDKTGVSLAVGGALSGRIIYANPTFSVGVFLDVK